MYNAFYSQVFDVAYLLKAQGLLLWKRFKIIEKLYSLHQKHFRNGWWEDAHPSSYPPGHKLQKLSKEPSIF